MTVILTVSILTMISATSLYIASQNANSSAQAASWQQALGAAESSVDQAIASLNTGTWTGWVTLTGADAKHAAARPALRRPQRAVLPAQPSSIITAPRRSRRRSRDYNVTNSLTG